MTHLALGSGSTCDNLNQFSSDDGLAGPIVENLELIDHVSCILRGVLRNVEVRRL